MDTKIITTADSGEWRSALERFEDTDVYFLPEYHQTFEMNGDGEAQAFLVRENDQTFFYPFMIRPIEQVAATSYRHQGLVDIETVYGYTGPLCTTTAPGFTKQAWAAFGAWCRDRNVVAEFVRFNPLLNTHQWASPEHEVAVERTTVILDLAGSGEDVWARYSSSQRNMVRKAEKKGLRCQAAPLHEHLDDFKSLYHATMRRLNAADYYFFSDAYYEGVSRSLAGAVKLFLVSSEGRILAAGLFLVHGKRIHYHLSATHPSARSLGPTNLMIHAAALWGNRHGCRCLHLGGGRTSRADDSLLRFKTSMSDERLQFRIGKRVHDVDRYRALCREWLWQREANERPNYFLMYRLP